MRPSTRLALRAATGALRGTAFALDIAADLTPGVRMAKRRRLPKRLFAGLLGAEVATWWAISLSLLPRPWWITAANVAICQGVGHITATSLAWTFAKGQARIKRVPYLPTSARYLQLSRAALATVTTVAVGLSLRRQQQQARLVEFRIRRSPWHLLVGGVVGTAGYGALLLIGEAAQQSVDQLGRRLSKFMPLWLSWPIAAISVGIVTAALSDRMFIRRAFANFSRNAEALNQSVFPGTAMPWEPERSGSPWSFEQWSSVGAQGRAVLALGPRARDIARITGMEPTEPREPIRIFIGLQPDRKLEEAARCVLAEMDRTGAFERGTIVVQTSAGSGWITDWSVCSVEFLTGGDCATVAMQYSYLPSAVAYLVDRDTPVRASRLLIGAILDRLRSMDPTERPRFYVAGESLGGYGIATAFEDLDDLLSHTDGALLSGSPRFTQLIRELSRRRDPGSPERLPIVDGGRHVRFVAHPDHLHHDFSDMDYRHDWSHPRMVVAQHASDPIVWWSSQLFWRRPRWLVEPGARGVSAPSGQHLDVVPGMRWVPFITAWQVGLDQLTSLSTPGGHGHNYHEEMLYYWDEIIAGHGAVRLTPDIAVRAEEFIRSDSVRR
ncbi:alpha/beta-hydrolase family protein [Corynebacterium alimapuense]|uniref:Alpha/beta-hydrolase catalytic domain-containing protein n=1 Tax=Corynebacterium alimapuense TaxID=1576874 RepID=A0A3M8KB47_9CORY|nr:alpha/beta-hydrolase family protein [Corynebacterium alimapuense]RNE50015.1 hypothetical protein C5L39_01190 [Corynebacterium alimapuense]